MTLAIKCPTCGQANQLDDSQAGRKVPCSRCGEALMVAVADGNGRDAAPGPSLRFNCPSCGRKYATKPEFAGKKIRCADCGTAFAVPGAEIPAAAPAAKSAGASGGAKAPTRAGRERVAPAKKETGDGDSSLLDELAAIEGVKRPKRAESILPSRSEAMEQVRQKVAEQEVVKAEKKAEKAKKTKKKKKASGYFDPKDTLTLVGGVAVFVGALAFLAWGYPDLRFPVGGILCIVGFIVYLLGFAALKQLVAEEGPLAAILFRFVPPYQWYFVVTRWHDAKDYVAFFGAGLLILTIGGVVIKSSPVGKIAQESERAYQKARNGPAEVVTPVPVGVAGEND